MSFRLQKILLGKNFSLKSMDMQTTIKERPTSYKTNGICRRQLQMTLISLLSSNYVAQVMLMSLSNFCAQAHRRRLL